MHGEVDVDQHGTRAAGNSARSPGRWRAVRATIASAGSEVSDHRRVHAAGSSIKISVWACPRAKNAGSSSSRSREVRPTGAPRLKDYQRRLGSPPMRVTIPSRGPRQRQNVSDTGYEMERALIMPAGRPRHVAIRSIECPRVCRPRREGRAMHCRLCSGILGKDSASEGERCQAGSTRQQDLAIVLRSVKARRHRNRP